MGDEKADGDRKDPEQQVITLKANRIETLVDA